MTEKANLIEIINRADKVWYGLSDSQKQEVNELKKELAMIEGYEEMAKQAKAEEASIRVKRSRGRGRYGERRLAKRVGGVVVGRSKAVKLPSGKYIQINCQKPPDVVTEMFSFESKWLKSVPKFLENVMGQAIRNCPEGLTPIGVIGDRVGKAVYYIMTERDWLELHG